jgi:probable phosphomutase (TIGR03848 family)
VTTVLLIRHGRTTANATGTLAGRSPGIDLDERGHAQAAALAERLAPVPLIAVVSSPLERTRQTADALIVTHPGTPLHIDGGLVECDYGHWTGRDLRTLSKEPLWKAVQAHASSVAFPAGESMAGMAARAVAAVRAWNATLGDAATYAVVSHGDVIKSIAADALGLHLDLFQRIQIDPGSVTVIRYTEHRPFILRVNDTGGDVAALIPPRRRTRRKPSGDADVGGGAGVP